MNVVVVGRDAVPDACTRDGRFVDVLDAALGSPSMVDFVLLAVREYDSHATFMNGRGYEARGFEAVVSRQKHGSGERARAARIVKGLDGLYRDYDVSHVRGVLVEQLVEQQLRKRYSGRDCLCDNNVKIELGPAASRHRTSKGVDVVGWDGRVGEGHDCKADAVSWRHKKEWLNELRTEVVPRGLAIALVTADHTRTARRKLQREQVEWSRLSLIGADYLFQRIPLNP